MDRIFRTFLRRSYGARFAYAFLLASIASIGLAASSGVTYHGRLLKPDGTPVSANTQFRIQIRTPGAENCLMFEESQSKDLSATNGMFSITVNDGNGTRNDAGLYTINQIFANRGTFTLPIADCNAINTYTPGAVDGRVLKVYFNDGTFAGWEPMPTQTINFVPMAIEAYSTGGFTAKSLLRVEDGATLGNVSSLTTANFNELMNLILGTSTQYTKTGQLNGSALPAMTNGQTLGWNGSAWTAVTPLTSESDPTVKAFAKSNLPTCSVGQVLKSDGTSLSCVTDAGGWTAVDATTSSKGIVQISATGGIDVNAGVIQLSDVGTSGDYYKVHTDAKGRVVSGSASLIEADIPNLTTAGKVSGNAITSGTIGGSTAISTSGNVTAAAGSFNSLTSGQLSLFDNATTNTNYVTIKTPNTTSLTSDYTLVLPPALATVNGQVLTSDTMGNLSWTTVSAGGGGTVTSVTSGGLPIVVGGSPTAPTVSVNAASTSATGVVQLAANGGTTAGTVVQADDSRLSDGRAPSGAAGGDLTGSYPNPTLKNTGSVGTYYKITTDAQGRVASGVATLSTADLSNASDVLMATNMPSNCGAGSTLTFSSPTGAWVCTPIVVSGSNFANQSQNTVFAGPTSGAGAPAFRVLTAADIPSLDWSKITTGTPTTLAGYNISDGVKNAGAVPSIQSGTFALMPSAAVVGSLYVTTDTKRIYRDNGSSWDLISASGMGTVTSVTSAAAPITIGGTLTDPTIGVNTASTSATGVVQLAANGGTTAGTVVQADDSRLSDGRAPSGAAGGDLTGSYPNPTLKNTGSVGTYYKITTDAQGRVASGVATLSTADLSNASDVLMATNMPSSCGAGSTLTFSSPRGTWACTPIAVTASNFGSQSANTFLAAPDGSSGTPSFRTIAAADLPASASYWQSATGGIHYSSGNVGIGTTTPGMKLDIQGSSGDTSLRIKDNATHGMAEINLQNDEQMFSLAVDGMGGNTFGIYDNTASQWRFNIKTNGNVGIGATSPTAKLEVNGSSGSTLKIVDGNQAAGKVLTSDGNGQASWQTPSGGGSASITTWSTPGTYTWTKPGTGSMALIECWGGGGSGGTGYAYYVAYGGGGGGGGAYSNGFFALASLPSSATVIVGSGGAAVSAGNTAGNVGGNSSFGSNIVAYGGGPGSAYGGRNAGGGGGGSLGVGKGSTGNNGGVSDGGNACSDDGYGGCTVLNPSLSSMNGGGGGGAGGYWTGTISKAGSSVNGGGGGAGCISGNAGTAGLSGHAGAGGAGCSGSVNGSTPSGGGGGIYTGTSGAGGNGQCRITIW